MRVWVPQESGTITVATGAGVTLDVRVVDHVVEATPEQLESLLSAVHGSYAVFNDPPAPSRAGSLAPKNINASEPDAPTNEGTP